MCGVISPLKNDYELQAEPNDRVFDIVQLCIQIILRSRVKTDAILEQILINNTK